MMKKQNATLKQKSENLKQENDALKKENEVLREFESQKRNATNELEDTKPPSPDSDETEVEGHSSAAILRPEKG